MGLVLSFSPRHAATSRQKPTGELASVIIFPGVRYERLDDQHDASAVQPAVTVAKGPVAH